MPLSELYRMARGKFDSSQDKNPSSSTDLSFVPENDFVELVWENGQISMQGQSSRAREIPAFKTRDKDIGNGENSTKMGKFRLMEMEMEMDSVLSEIPMSVVPSHDDEMVPWMKYTEPQDKCLETECSDILTESSGLTANEIPTHSSLASFNSIRRPIRNDAAGFKQGKLSKVPKLGDIGNKPSHAFTDRAICRDSTGVQPSVDALPGMKMQKQDPVAPCNNTALMNFSHFSRPAALVKVSLQNMGTMVRIESKEKGFVASTSNPIESTLIDSDIELLHKEKISLCHSTIVPVKTDLKGSEAKSLDEPVFAEPNHAICEENVPKSDKISSQATGDNTTKLLPHSDKAVGSAVAASSVCCGNRVERGSDDLLHDLKRKNRDDEEFECPNDDAEEESVGVKKSVSARGGKGSKRSRAAEVHNLSERRRRDRINEKMRSLQELIPNCNKVDKASMLDEAIEYLKTLQQQVQIMSMRTGLYMPHMMFPTGMQHMHAAHMARFASMGVGMGMGYGMPFPNMNTGASAFPMVQVPPIPGAPFAGPGPHMSGPTTLHDMTGSSLQRYGLHGQGHPMLIPGAPLMPIPGEHLMKSAIGSSGCGLVRPTDNIDSAIASSSKDPIQNIDSQVVQNTNINSSGNLASNQCETTNESFKQPAEVQQNSQASEITGSVPLRSTDEDKKLT